MDAKIEFTKALIKARSEFGELRKDKKGRFPYASVGAIRACIDQALKENGFGYTFEITHDNGPIFWLIIDHISGERRTSGYPLFDVNVNGKDPNQQFGGNLSYGMRHLLRTFFGLDADDNDPDNYDQETGEIITPQKQYVANPNNNASEKQIVFINRLIKDKNKDLQAILDYYKIQNLNNLKAHQASELISRLNNK